MLNANKFSVGVAVLAVLALGYIQQATAQDSLLVTGVSNPAAAWYQAQDGTQQQLGTRDMQISEVPSGAIGVAAGQQLMLFAESGSALIVHGPASLNYIPTTQKNLLVLEHGRVMIATGWPDPDVRPLVLTTSPDEAAPPMLQAVVCPGLTFYERSDDGIIAAFVTDTGVPPSMALTVRGEARSISSGQMIVVREGDVRTAPAQEWIEQSGLNYTWGVALGVASAQTARPALEATLFLNITTWDVYGGQKYVSGRLEAGRFRPEIRQVASTVTTPQRGGTTTKGAPQTQGFAAANEVPVLSPAALSVINTTENVTAIQLNVQARNLLSATGSRGLGFRGLSRLAIAGTFGDGIPTIGPPGLGKQD